MRLDFDLGLEKEGNDTWTWQECQAAAPIFDELGFLFFEQPMGDVERAQFDDYHRLKELMPLVQLTPNLVEKDKMQVGLIHGDSPWQVEDRVGDEEPVVGLTK